MGARRVSNAVAWRVRRSWTAGRNRLCGVHRHLPPDSRGHRPPRVALTFDDGPDPRFTPPVLDQLGVLRVPATFFCVGDRASEHPDLVRRMLAEGHQVGVHAGTHQDLWRLTTRQVEADLRRGRAILEGIAGRRLTLFRPAKGHVDVRVGALARGHGLRTWLWSVDPGDWRPGATSEEIAADAAATGPGDVILLHDGLEQPWAPEALDRSATVAALQPLVAALRAQDLDFVGLPA
jgi:peptidoglycan/xylan/chitin deacetylase (PgdA/CDA1 family)